MSTKENTRLWFGRSDLVETLGLDFVGIGAHHERDNQSLGPEPIEGREGTLQERTMKPERRLEEAIQGLKRTRPAGIETSPTSTFEALLDQRIKNLERQVEELKARTNWVLVALLGAIVAQVVSRLMT